MCAFPLRNSQSDFSLISFGPLHSISNDSSNCMRVNFIFWKILKLAITGLLANNSIFLKLSEIFFPPFLLELIYILYLVSVDYS